MEGVIILVIISTCAIIISPIITVAMVSRTNRRLDIFTRRSERLLDMLFKQANDPEAYKEDLGIFFNTADRKQREEQFTEAPERKEEKSEQAQKTAPKAPLISTESLRVSLFETADNQTRTSFSEQSEQTKRTFEPVAKAKRNWEKIIGENILNKIGIAILVLGIGYFVRHTFSNQNLQEVGNISVGFLAGLVLFFLGHRMRKTMRAFSSVLVGGAVSVFYFTVSIAFRDYELINQSTAALAAVGITGLSCFFASKYDRQELAIIALLGGLASPLMVSTGSGNHIVLFSYLIILNAGILFLANKKDWKALHPIAYIGTIIYLFGWWLGKTAATTHADLIEVLIFATVFFGMFLAQNLLAFKKESDKPRPFQLSLLASNSAALFGLGMLLLEPISDGKWQGLFVASLALIHGILTYVLFRKKHRDHFLKLLLTGLSLTFVSLIAPIQMSEHHITLFWAAEAAMLSWLGFRSKLTSISKSALVLTVIMLISLIMDWEIIYSENGLNPLLNRGFLATTAAVLGIAISSFWQKQWVPLFGQIELNQPGKTLKPLAVVVAFVGVFVELNYQLSRAFDYIQLKNLVLALYVYLFCFGWIWLKGNLQSYWNRSVLYALTFAGALAFLSIVRPLAVSFRDIALPVSGFDIFMVFHYSFYIILISAALKVRSLLKQFGSLSESQNSWLSYCTWFFLFIAITAEYNHLGIMISWHPMASISKIRSLISSPEHAILWSSMAFVAMYFGIKSKIKSLRYFGLGLFALALLRLFLFDLALISETGKTIAFVSLGILLLLVSFMYQRLKAVLF
ncbi:DUF2339 domain-containing protein [Halocola ammonii]